MNVCGLPLPCPALPCSGPVPYAYPPHCSSARRAAKEHGVGVRSHEERYLLTLGLGGYSAAVGGGAGPRAGGARAGACCCCCVKSFMARSRWSSACCDACRPPSPAATTATTRTTATTAMADADGLYGRGALARAGRWRRPPTDSAGSRSAQYVPERGTAAEAAEEQEEQEGGAAGRPIDPSVRPSAGLRWWGRRRLMRSWSPQELIRAELRTVRITGDTDSGDLRDLAFVWHDPHFAGVWF
jgi:hypothetical protein